MSGRRSLRASVQWAFVMNLGQRGLSTGFTFVLVALLGPEEFGLIAMGLAFVSLIQVVLEQGISTAIVQRERMDARYLDAALWLNLAWCALLAGVAIALSGWWASVNDTAQLQDVILALSALFPLWGLMIVPMALLQRDSRFKELAVAWNLAALGGGLVGVGAALAGAGVWAFVAQQVVMEAIAVAVMWFVVRWRPRLAFSRPHARELLRFSSSVFVANMGGFVNRRADTLLLGVFFGPAAVGLYRLADRIVDLALEFTMRPVGAIALPHFSRLQSDPEGLREGVEKCLRLTVVAAVPALAVVAATSDFLIGAFGPEWAPAAAVLPFLCVVGLVKGLVFFTGPLLFAVAKPLLRAAVLWVLGGLSAITVVVVGAALTSSSVRDQIVGMGASRAALFVAAILPLNLMILRRYGGLRLARLRRTAPGAVAAALAAGAAGLGLQSSGVLAGVPAVAAAAAAVAAVAAVAVAALALLEPDTRSELRSLRERLTAKGASARQPVPD